MASLTCIGFEEMVKRLDKLSKKPYLDDATKKAVNAAKGHLVSTMKAAIAHSEASRASSNPRSTGAVSASVQATEAKVNSYGTYAVSKPTGHHPSVTIRNAELAAYLEYGGHNLEARPWRASASSMAENACAEIMENTLKAELELD